MSTEATAPRWLVVVYRDRPDVLAQLSRTFEAAPWVGVLADRRRNERRKRQVLIGSDLRLGDRRGTAGDPVQRPSYRLARQGEGFDVFEATGYAAAQCGECGATVMFEMPRSGEPPTRFDVHVVHEQTEPRPRARHFVELLLYAAGGRPLLACRSFARSHVEVG
jgi:hypothetical protein